MVSELHYIHVLFAEGGFPRMGYNYNTIHAGNQLHTLMLFVSGITSHCQMSFFYRARAQSPVCLE